MWNVENGVGLVHSTKLFAPEDGPLNLAVVLYIAATGFIGLYRNGLP